MTGYPRLPTLLKWAVGLLWLLASLLAQAQVCAAPGKDGTGFSRNTYFPGLGSAAAGSTVVNLGSARSDADAATTPFAVGDLALVIQMQDALVNNTDSAAYGDGVGGDPASGSTNLRSAGFYEFRRVTAVAGSSITLDAPLSNTYTTANADATSGHRRFQVVRVPQFASLTLPGGTLNVTPWDGSTGGVIVLDVSGTLSLNGTTLNADAAGYRGGGSQEAAVISGSNVTTYASAQVAGIPPANLGAAKGEGIAGTPRFVRSDTVVANGYTGRDLGSSGYPGGFDLARGAPANAGGGGTQHNAGGGGGGNAGTGGRGGNSFAMYSATDTGGCVAFGPGYFACGGDFARAVGGFGGQGLTPVATRLFLGGGGGAGEANNAADNVAVAQGSGGNGGGLIFVRARTVSGSGLFTANGGAGQPGGRDAAGGGGGGGTVVLVTDSPSVPGLQVSVAGGAGGNTGLPLTGNETQGTGGGGGGGAFIRTTGVSVGAASVSGGASGVNTPVAGVSDAFGAAGGAGGAANVTFSGSQYPNPSSCFPALTVSKSTTTPTRTIPTDATATYVVGVRNATGVGAALGVAVRDVLPAPFTLAGSTAVAQLAGGSLGPAPSTASGTSTVTLSTPGGGTGTAYFIPPGGGVTLTFQVNLNGASPGTYQNPADAVYSDPTRTVAGGTVSPGGAYAGGGTAGGSNYASASSTQEDVSITALTLLTVSKTNGVGTLTAGSTTSYTITVANEGAVDTPNAVLSDPVVTGLNCTALSCSVASGAAVCPVAPALSLANLQGSGVVISTLPAGSSLQFQVTCTVTATGVP
jgi:uncharacterized repeat protein (TIGR01451 family)